MKNLVCFLEEASAKVMLEAILPKVLPEGTSFSCHTFEGKQDMDKQLERRLKNWQKPNSYFLILRDKDSGDCMKIKEQLAQKVSAAGKQDFTCIRIACHELESFYLGDLSAIEKGLSISGLAKLQTKNKFRAPDRLANASDELKKITSSHKPYQKVAGSRSIAPHLSLDGSNTSTSFKHLVTGIQKLFV